MKGSRPRAGLQDCNPVTAVYGFVFRKTGRNPPGLESMDVGMGIALSRAQHGFSRKTVRCSTFSKFVISEMGLPRGSLHPASGSDGEGCPLPPSCPRVHARRLRGHSPLLGFPRFLRARLLPSPLLAPLQREKRTWPSRPSPWVRMVAPAGIEPGTRGFSVNI